MENVEMNFLLFWIPLMMTGVLIVLIISWFDHRTRRKGLELLRAYADRGEDPPESMVEALAAISAWGHPKPKVSPPSDVTRNGHFRHVAGSTVIALGSAWLAWWLMPEDGAPGGMVIFAVIVAIFFAGGAAARLVAALGTPSRGRAGDDR